MVTLAIDDDLQIAKTIRDRLREKDPEGIHYVCSEISEAIDVVRANHVDIVWIDIRMPERTGFDLVAEIKRITPDTDIVFVTVHPEDVVNARGMGSGEANTDILIKAQCFGNFEVFDRYGDIIKFSRSLSKEAFAYLVDRRGAACTIAEICSVLWGDRTIDKNLKSQCRVMMSSLRRDLEQADASDVLIKKWNSWSVDTRRIKCDYYDFIKDGKDKANSFHGEYMAQYSWAKMEIERT